MDAVEDQLLSWRKQLHDKADRDPISEREMATLELWMPEARELVLTSVEDHEAAEAVSNHFIAKANDCWNTIASRESLPRCTISRRYMWIDAICINQKDFNERALQVRLIAKVYLQANLLVNP
jgi:hypothetical protein